MDRAYEYLAKLEGTLSFYIHNCKKKPVCNIFPLFSWNDFLRRCNQWQYYIFGAIELNINIKSLYVQSLSIEHKHLSHSIRLYSRFIFLHSKAGPYHMAHMLTFLTWLRVLSLWLASWCFQHTTPTIARQIHKDMAWPLATTYQKIEDIHLVKPGLSFESIPNGWPCTLHK